jgi:hypothetical protein
MRAHLAPAETRVATLIGAGLSPRQAAEKLGREPCEPRLNTYSQKLEYHGKANWPYYSPSSPFANTRAYSKLRMPKKFWSFSGIRSFDLGYGGYS